MLTIVVKAMTLAMALTAGLELFYMQNPELGEYTKLLTPAEMADLAPVSF